MLTLDDLSNAVQELKDSKEIAARKEQELKDAKAHVDLLSQETIPGMMNELGFNSVELESGEKISIKQNIYVQLSKDDKPKMFQWLNENGHGGLIKIAVNVQFGKGDRDEAINLYNELEDEFGNAGITEDVHSQTLKAFLREQLEKGADIPLNIFGASPVMEVNLERPRRSKRK